MTINATRAEMAAAMAVAAQKLIESGMTIEEMRVYIEQNAERMFMWCAEIIEKGRATK